MDEQDRGNFEPLNAEQSAESDAPASAEDYAAQSRQAGNWSPPPPAPTVPPATEDARSGHRNLIVWVVGLVALALLAGAVYWFSLRHKPATSGSPPQTNTTSPQQSAATTPSSIDKTTKSYTSSNLNLKFSYPADWTVADNGGGIISVKSPALPLATVSGSQQGIIVLTIRNHAQTLSEFTKGNATATRDSQKMAYNSPTPSQRANTYLSFLQYATTTTTGTLDGIYITGDNGYQKDQAIPGADVGKADPRISITFTDVNGKALSIADKAWDDTNFSGPLTKMLQSFSIN